MKTLARLVIVALTLGFAGLAPADERKPILERVAVGLIELPVFVEDNRGQAITELSAGDFEIFEDGKKMKIKDFAWVSGTEAAGAAAASESPKLHVVLFVDSQNIRPAHRQQVLKQLAPLVERDITAGVPLMLAASRPNVEVLKAFSAPRSVLPYRLEELGKSASGGLFDANAARLQRDEINRSVRRIFDCVRNPGCDLRAMESVTTSAIGEIRAYGFGVADQVRGTLERFQHFARSLSSFPGTKAVLYISDGFPMQAGQDLLDELREAVREVVNKADPGSPRESTATGGPGSYQGLLDIVERSPMDFFSNDISKMIEQTTAAANANGVRIYTLQASALTHASAAEADDQAALRLLANSTGGKFLQGGTRAETMLRQMMGDTRSYYSITYSPPPAAEQSYHQVEVKVKKRRMRARYPHGYLTRSDQSRRIEQVLAALFHGYGENDAEIALDLGPGGRNDKEQPVIQMKVRIPVRAMALERRGDQHATDLKLIVAVMNGAGRTTMLREFPVAVQIPGQHIEQAREQDYPVRLTVPASRGTNRVAVGLWDESADRPALTHGVFEWVE